MVLLGMLCVMCLRFRWFPSDEPEDEEQQQSCNFLKAPERVSARAQIVSPELCTILGSFAVCELGLRLLLSWPVVLRLPDSGSPALVPAKARAPAPGN